MKVQPTWEMKNYQIVLTKLSRSTKSVDEVLDELGYSDDEKEILRGFFIV